MPLGKVYLVGAGPGDPGLLTLRGKACLEEADLVLYDYLANPHLLRHAAPQAQLVCLGRHGKGSEKGSGKGESRGTAGPGDSDAGHGDAPTALAHGRLLPQEEVNRQMIEAARTGKTVVRLKGGDVGIFGRAAEETAALEAAGIPYEVVPGVTTAMTAGSHAGIWLTDREQSSCVALVTGHECRSPEGQKLDFDALARFPGTLVFYMGVTTAADWVAALLEHGKPADTPTAIIRHCSLPKQEVIETVLGDLPQVIAERRLRPPAIILVGEVVGTRAQADWFMTKPLFGRTVLVTRPAHQAEPMLERLIHLGAEVLCQPAIEITPPDDWQKVDAAIGRLGEFDWLVFSSANGVRYFLDRLLETGHDLRALAHVKLAAIGPATVEALAEYRLKADCQPDEYRAEALAETLAGQLPGPSAGQGRAGRMLLLRASRGREVLAEMLTAAGAQVEQAVVYESRDVAQLTPEVAEALAAGNIDWITATSSAIARSLVQLFGDDLRRAKLAAISPLTAQVLAEAGVTPAAVATDYTGDGLIDAIVQAEAE